jgi:hypothetical protein
MVTPWMAWALSHRRQRLVSTSALHSRKFGVSKQSKSRRFRNVDGSRQPVTRTEPETQERGH